MHVVFVGGGAHRYLGVARSILNDQAFEHPSSIGFVILMRIARR